MSQNSVKEHSITSHCSGYEPALLPKKEEQLDPRQRQKSSLSNVGKLWKFQCLI